MLEKILTSLDWNHFLSACGLGVLSWLGYELRQWRVFWQNKHGGAPDAEQPKPKATSKK